LEHQSPIDKLKGDPHALHIPSKKKDSFWRISIMETVNFRAMKNEKI